MGNVYRSTYTKPLPLSAEIIERKGERVARWKDAKGKIQTADITTPKAGKYAGQDRIVQAAATYTARYKDGSGNVCLVATGCKDETAAKQVLANLEQRADKVRSGVRSKAEDAVVDHRDSPLDEHITGYIEFLAVKGAGKVYQENSQRQLERVFKECRWTRLGDLNRNGFESWLNARLKEEMGARNRNVHRSSLVAFCNWCIDNHRLLSNPFDRVPKANEELDPRRHRRAMTEAELVRLLDVARRRPLQDSLMIRRGANKGKLLANLSEETRARLDQEGRERALIYKNCVPAQTTNRWGSHK